MCAVFRGGMRRLIHEWFLNEHRRLDTLENGGEALDAGPGLTLPGIEEGETDFAVLVEIRVEASPSIIRKIRECGRLKWIVVGEADLEAEYAAVIGGAFATADDGPTMHDVCFTWNPEKPLVCELKGFLGVDHNPTNC